MNINICLITDDNYAIHLAVTVVSILKNANQDDKLNFYIIDDNISQKNKEILKNIVIKFNAELFFLDVSKYKTKFENCEQRAEYITTTSYFKYIIADLIPEVDKIIYLDCDLVVEESLAELFDIDLKDYLIGAVEDVGYVHWRQFNKELLVLEGFVINSGVMLINCKKWREENLSEKFIDYTINKERPGLGQDQPIINIICKNKILPLAYKWNVQDSFYRYSTEVSSNPNKEAIIESTRASAIIHYTGAAKPWNNTDINIDIAAADRYYKYFKYTPYYKAENKFIKIFKLFFNKKR